MLLHFLLKSSISFTWQFRANTVYASCKLCEYYSIQLWMYTIELLENISPNPCRYLATVLAQWYIVHCIPIKVTTFADFLISCSNVYRIKHYFMHTYPYVLQTIMQSNWKIRLHDTQKSNFPVNCTLIWVCSITKKQIYPRNGRGLWWAVRYSRSALE